MNARRLWSNILVIVGFIAMLIGAIDPLEGSIECFKRPAQTGTEMQR